MRPLLPARFELTGLCLPRLLSSRQWNDGEARVVMEHVRRLMAAGVPASDIGIITPYNAQVGHCGVQLYAYACCTARIRPGMLASDCAGARAHSSRTRARLPVLDTLQQRVPSRQPVSSTAREHACAAGCMALGRRLAAWLCWCPPCGALLPVPLPCGR